MRYDFNTHVTCPFPIWPNQVSLAAAAKGAARVADEADAERLRGERFFSPRRGEDPYQNADHPWDRWQRVIWRTAFRRERERLLIVACGILAGEALCAHLEPLDNAAEVALAHRIIACAEMAR